MLQHNEQHECGTAHGALVTFSTPQPSRRPYGSCLRFNVLQPMEPHTVPSSSLETEQHQCRGETIAATYQDKCKTSAQPLSCAGGVQGWPCRCTRHAGCPAVTATAPGKSPPHHIEISQQTRSCQCGARKPSQLGWVAAPSRAAPLFKPSPGTTNIPQTPHSLPTHKKHHRAAYACMPSALMHRNTTPDSQASRWQLPL